MAAVCNMIAGVKAMGLETCMTLGMLTGDQAHELKAAGLDYYNHNIDTSPEHYGDIITTRTFQERLDTLEEVRNAGMAVCCGGIVGMGETRSDRVGFLHVLARKRRFEDAVDAWDRVSQIDPSGPFAAPARSRARSARDLQHIFAAQPG